MQGFMDEFNRRAEESDSPELLRVFEKLVETLGVETCSAALERVKEQRQQYQQQQQQHLPGYKSNTKSATASSTSAYPIMAAGASNGAHARPFVNSAPPPSPRATQHAVFLRPPAHLSFCNSFLHC